ncbi:MAG: DNA alkylation repair protein [Bacteroidetes bacterium]|nr:DNA alkylation repair protein [Bacteroidota bacterium]
MAEPLKNMFSKEYLNNFADVFVKIYPKFDKAKFLNLVFDNDWDNKELKQRMRHISVCLHAVLPSDYKKSVDILRKAVVHSRGFLAMTFPDYVEVYGLEDYDTSISALELFTQYGSSEFAIRLFIIRYSKKLMPQMLKWAKHKNYHVRRLASEGSRPRLPWAMGLPEFKKNPSEVLKILEILKNDESEYVRKSVANNLNDISKDNPDIAFETAKKWFGKSPKTDWIIKHGLRGLLKKGNVEALKLFGFTGAEGIKISDLKFDKNKIKVGEKITFSFKMKTDREQKIRLEYIIDFITSSGKNSKKIFKITENVYEKGKMYEFKKSHSFKDLTVRKHFKGSHTLSIIINGGKLADKKFEII